MAPMPQNHAPWDQHEGASSRFGSPRSSVILEEGDFPDDDAEDARRPILDLQRRRRSSVTQRISALADIGGVNSFRSFARSWQRAASFAEVIPRRPSFVLATDSDHFPGPEGDGIQYGRSQVDDSCRAPVGLIGQHLQASSPQGVSAPTCAQQGRRTTPSAEEPTRDDIQEQERWDSDAGVSAETLFRGSPSTRSSIFAVPPHLAAPDVLDGYGSPYGTVGGTRYRRRRSSADERGGEGRENTEADDGDTALGEEHPILVKEVQQGDKVILAVEGQSTLPQSIFNSINAIIGVGLLSLPLAFKMSGWILGLVILTLTASVTAHTGRLLGKCMEYDPSIVTYSDLAYVAFGTRARVIVSALFTLELVAACVALVILFSDSLGLLFPDLASGTTWKCFCAYILDTCLAVIGILMFGDGIEEAITSNILKTSGYPESLTLIMCGLITFIPLTKIPLNARPLVTTADVLCGIHRDDQHRPSCAPSSPAVAKSLRALVRVLVVLVLLGISVAFPAFDSVCAFLGAALCSLISVILPVCFYLKLYHGDITRRERVVSWVLLVTFSALGTVGTIWTFLPRHLVGA
ncbi:hypothetical protein UVI_02022590 [Ustilaginoidea virens]|uniref:Amino acid transporter transmembrane domain-containing protein n=1 Tax=Ustilaginoidea virens TaxID=1159556 RepID=A0A1B5L7Q9_USTVR|nr:hypothetical protein UVI_02022590 [Ustilaginoidea virens]